MVSYRPEIPPKPRDVVLSHSTGLPFYDLKPPVAKFEERLAGIFTLSALILGFVGVELVLTNRIFNGEWVKKKAISESTIIQKLKIGDLSFEQN